jgi:hypothetical protein
MARPKGFEPLTSASGGQRSIQLSYGRIPQRITEKAFVGMVFLRDLTPTANLSGRQPEEVGDREEVIVSRFWSVQCRMSYTSRPNRGEPILLGRGKAWRLMRSAEESSVGS